MKTDVNMITSLDQLNLNKTYSFADYLSWRFKERVELFRGKIFKMPPAPNLEHQRISGEMYGYLWSFLKREKRSCQVFSAPFDVRLPVAKGERKDTVVQPDITVVCHADKLDQHGCKGSPDLVVEILSPGNTKREMLEKFQLYQQAEIPEYWLVDPEHQFAIVYHLNAEGKYIGSPPYPQGTILESKVLQGFRLDMNDIFPETNQAE